MGRGLFPDTYFHSTYDIPFEALYRRGYRAVLFDIDNTLVMHDAPADGKAKALFRRLHETGFASCLISNNKEPRVKSFAEAVGTKYIYKAGKPSPKGYRRAMEMLGIPRERTLFVGDQIFTDVLGANLAGCKTIMVRRIDPREEIQIVLKRIPETPVMLAFFLCRHLRGKGREHL